MAKFLSGKKTYFLMGLGILKVFILTMAGDMSVGEFLASPQLQELFVYLAGMTFRAAIDKPV